MRCVLLLIALLLASCASGLLHSAVDYYVSGEYEKAIQTADWALETRNPTAEECALANLIKAQSFDKLGDRESAFRLYHHLLDAYPETSHAYQARHQLRRLERASAVAP